ncbi:hypothetical protein PoB_003272700 [Plakobranchus ocellatus]|uniref:Uncharacterized protein n=1 Tax=Plakobranchus ocellatus TaxID=259542 RepID=A0AAV4AH36_9GAST|nr:hypothetical protein PoB_003272700 [Plakobranchus ocellatus]
MLRWLICKGRGQLDKMKEIALAALAAEKQEKALFLKELQQRQAKIQPSVLPSKGRPPPQPPHPPPLPPPPSYSHLHHSSTFLALGHVSGNTDVSPGPTSLSELRGASSGLEDFSSISESNGPHSGDGLTLPLDTDKAHNPLLSNLLDGKPGKKSQGEVHDSPMLSLLLDDNTSVATTVTPMTSKPTPKGQNKRKRRPQTDIAGPNPKHRFNDNDRINSPSDRLSSMGSSLELDMVPNLMEHGLPSSPSIMGPVTSMQGTPSHHQHHHHQQQHSISNHGTKASRTQGNVIDLTDDVGESNLKKLADSVEHFMHKDVKSEPDLPVLLNETEAPSRIPNILQNSPSGSKNEHASTSLEGYLKRSGEVGRAKDFDPSDVVAAHNSTSFSKLSSLLLASTDSPSSVLSAPPHKSNSHFFSDNAFSVGGINNSHLIQDVKPNIRKGPLRQSSSMELPNEMSQGMTGIFEKFEMPRNQQNCKMDVSDSNMKPQLLEGKVSLKLKVGPLKQQNNVRQVSKLSNPVSENKTVYRKANNIGTFDFKSDEDDDDTLAFHERSLYSASPTIPNSSSKQRHLSDSTLSKKPEKIKKKDRGSGNAYKRKRDKEESKREKKRKKSEHHIQDSIYRTVENDGKADIKLKIKVISDKSDSFSEGNVQSYEISKKSSPFATEKEVVTLKPDFKESLLNTNDSIKEKDTFKPGYSTNKGAFTSKSASGSHKNLSKSSSSKTIQSGTLSNKGDPKLSTKATIRLKPLTMPSTGSTINVSQSGSKTTSVNSGTVTKSDRRSSSTSTASNTSEKRFSSLGSSLERKSSSSNLMDRKNSSQNSSVSTSSSSLSSHPGNSSASTTTVSSSLSLSSILPNAPTTSRIASLPRIPKLSSSSSNTSLNRTSSLDSASGTSPTSAGTKSSNSYNTGPAGRSNILGGTGGNSGVGNRVPVNASASFYSRPPGPGVSMAGGIRPNYGLTRMAGQGLRQGSPLGNSGPGSFKRTPGTRAHNPSGFGQGGNANKLAGSVPTNLNVKGNTGSSNHISQNIAQRTFGNGGKRTDNTSNVSKTNIIPKSILVGSVNNLGAHRHTNQNTHGSSGMRTPLSSSSNVSRSPNTATVTKSPSSGKSPNITSNAGRSPNITSSGRSPSVNNPSRSPNINKSPNINSSTTCKSPSPNMNPSRSPNLNPSKSPSIASSVNRSSSNPSPTGRSLSNSTNKISANITKIPTTVSKIVGGDEVAKPVPIYVPQKSFNSISHKTPQTKSVSPKVTPTLSSITMPQVSSKSPNTSTLSSPTYSNKVPVSAISNTSQPSSETCVSSISAQKLAAQLSTTCSSVESQGLSIVSQSNRQSQHAASSSSVLGSVQISSSDAPNGISCAPSSTPSTPISADGAKKFSFPASRGRKNSCSLSAIVDKLKHNAAGGGVDTTQAVVGHGEGSGIADKLKGHSSDLSASGVCVADSNSVNQISSPNQINSISKSPQLKSVTELKPSGTDIHSFANMSTISEIKGDVPIETKTVHRMTEDLVRTNETSVFTVQNNQSSSVSSPMLSPRHSPALSSLAPSFQLQATPGAMQGTPRTPILTVGPSKISDSGQKVFKVPSAKPISDQQEDEGDKAGENSSGSIKPSRQEVIESPKAGENENKPGVEKLTGNKEKRNSGPAKSLASPLSDISSPENGLIIDDEESPRGTARTSVDLSLNVNSLTKPLALQKARKSESSIADVQFSKDSSCSPQHSLDESSLQTSPKTVKLTPAKSPALSKTVSAASTPKGSDSPCEIDDDLMDVALGFGS